MLLKTLKLCLSLNIFILHRLRNKFLQLSYTKLSRFCFLGTTPALAPNVWANEKIPKLTPAPMNRTQDLKTARPTLYLLTTDTTVVFHRIENIVRKEENSGYQHFFLSHNVFTRLFPPVHQKSSLCGNGLKSKDEHIIL